MLYKIKLQTKRAKSTLKNTAVLAQSLAIFAFSCHSFVIKSTQASIAEFKASIIKISIKTLTNNKCSKKLTFKKKLKTIAGIIIQSSILNAISFLNKAKIPSKAYLALFKNDI